MKRTISRNLLSKKYHSVSLQFFVRRLLFNCLLILIPILLIGLYSIFRAAGESTQASRQKDSVLVQQTDDILESFYTHVDNAYLFFASNPRVSLELRNSFAEKSLSLDSLRSIENISRNFQTMVYTDDYLQSIYVYYKNNYSRIFAPLSSQLLSFSPETEKQILNSYDYTGLEDTWIEFSSQPLLYTEYSAPSLLIYRKLYRRTTDIQNGLLIFRFSAERLRRKLEKLQEYPDQLLCLVDTQNRLIWPAPGLFSEQELLRLAEETISLRGQTDSPVSHRNISGYALTYLTSPRSYGLSILLMTPKNRIYENALALTGMYIAVTLAAVAVAFLLAFFQTQHDYRYLDRIIRVFQSPDMALKTAGLFPEKKSSPFDYILMNIIRLFIEQDYLKIQDSEKNAKLQLSKMQALQHQINPHFLHNTLNGIYWESVKLTGSENQCSQMISYLSSIMRYSLGDPGENVKILNEIDYLKKYLKIMELRHPGKFRVRFSVQPDCLIFPIKKMLLQPLVENAFYHGIKEKPGTGLIRISIHRKRDRIYVTVYDTGAGMTPARLASLRDRLSDSSFRDSGEHIGMANTNLRLTLSYGPKACLHVNSQAGLFTAVWFSV